MKHNSDKVAAVVVTYNRLELLKKTLDSLINQTKSLDYIIIVNNGSTDGTSEFLNDFSSKNLGIEIITQENLGGAGGFYTGSITAYNKGSDWIWLMDDDVVAAANCLEELCKYRAADLVVTPKRITNEGVFFENDVVKINMKNPFKGIWKQIISKEDIDINDAPIIPIESVTFEGPMFHRSCFEKCGFPEKNFFIYADDTEFSIRLSKSKFKFAIIKDAVFNRLLPVPSNIYEFNWKTYYMVRNIIAIDTLHGNKLIRYIRPFGYGIKWIGRCKNLNNIKTIIKAFKDGYFYKTQN